MPYNIKPITDPKLAESRKQISLSPEWMQNHAERAERLHGQVKDYDSDAFEDSFRVVKSSLWVLADGLKARFTNDEWEACPASFEDYYFNLVNILDQIDRIEAMVDGYDEFVSRKQAAVMGLDDYVPPGLDSEMEVLA